MNDTRRADDSTHYYNPASSNSTGWAMSIFDPAAEESGQLIPADIMEVADQIDYIFMVDM